MFINALNLVKAFIPTLDNPFSPCNVWKLFLSHHGKNSSALRSATLIFFCPKLYAEKVMSDYVVCHVTFLSKDGFWIFICIERKLETFFTEIKRKENWKHYFSHLSVLTQDIVIYGHLAKNCLIHPIHSIWPFERIQRMKGKGLQSKCRNDSSCMISHRLSRWPSSFLCWESNVILSSSWQTQKLGAFFAELHKMNGLTETIIYTRTKFSNLNHKTKISISIDI